jgi:GT2 family glycosyltransferase
MAMTVDISVVICTYSLERWGDLNEAIESVKLQSYQPLELIVVVDHNQELFERVHTQIAGIRAIENREVPGLSGGKNSAIAEAKGTLIAFLDDDAIAEPDWLMFLNRQCEDPLVMGAGGRVEPLWLAPKPAWFPDEFYWVIGCSYRGLPNSTSSIRNPFGGCMCIRREVFDAVGGFRSEIGHSASFLLGCEETELCIRARHNFPNMEFIYEPRAMIRHRIPASRTRWDYFYMRCYAEGRSKALVSELVGAKDGLASEQQYTLYVLPKGILKGIIDAITSRDMSGFVRALVIILGLAITVAGYIRESIFIMRTRTFKPMSRKTSN